MLAACSPGGTPGVRSHELGVAVGDLSDHSAHAEEHAHGVDRPRERDEEAVDVLVVRQVGVPQRHAEGHHVDDDPGHGDVGEHRVVPPEGV